MGEDVWNERGRRRRSRWRCLKKLQEFGSVSIPWTLASMANSSHVSFLPNGSCFEKSVKNSMPQCNTDSSVCIHIDQVSCSTYDLRQRGSPGNSWVHPTSLSGIITPFTQPHFTTLSTFVWEFRQLLRDPRAKRVAYLISFVLLSSTFLFSVASESNSMALTAYTYFLIFDLLVLLTCLVSFWVEQQTPSSSFTLGYGRFEVLAVFSSVVLGYLGALFIFKECVEKLFLQEQPTVDGNKMLLGCGVALVCRLIVIYFTDSKAWNHVFTASKSSWLQEQVAEFSENLCHLIPGLSRFLMPRLSPFVLMACTGAGVMVVTHLLVQLKGYSAADTLAAIFLALLTWCTLFPMGVYTGLILLQTTPSHIVGQLEKCLREAATLDGVLEFRDEHFWTLSFGILAGSLHVRVRRDANEQSVLAHLAHRLSGLVSVITIQVFKDDWTRSTTTMQILRDSARVVAFPSATPVSVSYDRLSLPPPPPYQKVNPPLSVAIR